MANKELEEMNLEELKIELKKKEDLFEEVEEEREWMLAGTQVHVPGTTVKKYEAELNSIKAKIEEIKKLIQSKQYT